MALGESWFGITKNIGNFVTLNISNGIGLWNHYKQQALLWS